MAHVAPNDEGLGSTKGAQLMPHVSPRYSMLGPKPKDLKANPQSITDAMPGNYILRQK